MTPTDRTSPASASTGASARPWLARRADDLIVLAAGLGLALPFIIPLS